MADRFMDRVDYDKMLSALEASIPGEITGALRDSLKSKLKYGNEFSLRRRLRDLVEPLPSSIRQMILMGNDQVPQMWIDTRNYYTHSLGGTPTSVLGGAGMHRAGVRLKILLRVLYLHQLGVSDAILVGALNGTNKESQFLQQLFGERSLASE